MNIAALLQLLLKNPQMLGVLTSAPQIIAQFDAPKDGHKTTEFWLVAAMNAFALLSPAVSPDIGMMVAGGLTGVYAVARAVIKGLHSLGKAQAEPDLPDLPAAPISDAAKKQLGV